MEVKTTATIDKILKKIRDTRKIHGLSHENMAHELNMSPSAYFKLERGETILSLDRLLKIKDILNLPFSAFFDLKSSDTFNQDMKNTTADVQNLYHENKEINDKFIQTLQEEIVFLRGLLKDK